MKIHLKKIEKKANFIGEKMTNRTKKIVHYGVSYSIIDLLKEYGINNDKYRYSQFEKKFEVLFTDLCPLWGGMSDRDEFNIKTHLSTPNGKRYKNKELVEQALVALRSQDFDADEAFAYIKKKHEEGNPLASYILASCYFIGKFQEKDIDKAQELLLKSGNTGFVPAIFWFGYVVEYHSKADNHLTIAFKAYEQAAELGYDAAKDRLPYLKERIEMQTVEERRQRARLEQEEQRKRAKSEIAQKRKEYAQKYGVATQQALDNVQIKVGMPFAAIKEYISDTGKNDYSYKLSIDHGSKKCYDIYIEVITAQKIGYVWVTNGKITSVVKY